MSTRTTFDVATGGSVVEEMAPSGILVEAPVTKASLRARLQGNPNSIAALRDALLAATEPE